MYLHLGDEFVIPTHNLIGIFDLDAVTSSSLGRRYLQNAEKQGRLHTVGENIPKSFIVCGKFREESVYLSPISAATLLKRISRGSISGADVVSEV
jgi:hypothetical protein